MSLRVVSVVYYVLLAVFIAWYVRGLDLSRLSGTRPDFVLLSAATLVALGYRFWGAFIWQRMLVGLGVVTTPPWRELQFVYAKSWLGRYLPGKVTWILGKVWFGAALGIPKERLAVSASVEALQQLAVTIILALAVLGSDAQLDVFTRDQRIVLFAVAAMLAVVMLPPVFNGALSLVRRVLQRAPMATGEVVTGAVLTRGVLLQSVGFLLTGASYVMLAFALVPSLELNAVAFLFGTFTLAGAIGVLAVFAPSGLGVREGVQLLLLPQVMTAEETLVLVVLARLWSTAADGAFFGVAWLLRGRTASQE